MQSPNLLSLTIAQARRNLGIPEGEPVQKHLGPWLAMEKDLKERLAAAGDLETTAQLRGELQPLQNCLDVLAPERGAKPKKAVLIWVVLLVGVILGGVLIFQDWTHSEGAGEAEFTGSVTEQSFRQAIEKRRWAEAEELVAELRSEGASQDQIEESYALIASGKREEKGQQAEFLVGNFRSAIESGLLESAQSSLARIEEFSPDHAKLPELRRELKGLLAETDRRGLVSQTEAALEAGKWSEAILSFRALEEIARGHEDTEGLRGEVRRAAEMQEAQRARAAVMLREARELDEGEYAPALIKLVREAVQLDASPENQAYLSQVLNYGKVVRVPADFGTIAEALAEAEANDRILIDEGVYQESLILPAGVELVGKSLQKTVIECSVDQGPVLSVLGGERRARVSGLTVKHQGLVGDDERYPAVAVDGGVLHLQEVLISRASGHGVAVLNEGRAQLTDCEITECGWDGVSVKGERSHAILKRVRSLRNLHHGVDFWDGGSGEVQGCVLQKNGRAGLFAIETRGKVVIEKTKVTENKELGVHLSNVAAAAVLENTITENLLGGVLVENASKAISLVGNEIVKNGEAGLVLEAGVEVLRQEENVVTGNVGRQIWAEAVFPSRQEEIIPPAAPVN